MARAAAMRIDVRGQLSKMDREFLHWVSAKRLDELLDCTMENERHVAQASQK
jgi:hypothetical protein